MQSYYELFFKNTCPEITVKNLEDRFLKTVINSFPVIFASNILKSFFYFWKILNLCEIMHL